MEAFDSRDFPINKYITSLSKKHGEVINDEILPKGGKIVASKYYVEVFYTDKRIYLNTGSICFCDIDGNGHRYDGPALYMWENNRCTKHWIIRGNLVKYEKLADWISGRGETIHTMSDETKNILDFELSLRGEL